MIKKIKSEISVGDAAIVCTKVVSFKEILEKYKVLSNDKIKEVVLQSGISIDETTASFSGAVSVDSKTNMETAKLLAEARCDLKVVKFVKRLVYVIVKAETKQFKNGQKTTQRNTRHFTNKDD